MLNLKSKKILLVEDEVIIALMQVQQLKKEGYEVIHATDGEEAIAIVINPIESIDLILMDIDLGFGMDGTETAKMILEKYDIPIIFLSSHIEKELVQKTETITSYGYVVKSSGITVLDASIKMAFKLYEANKKTEFQIAERTKKLQEEIEAHAQTEKSWLESEDRFRVAQDISLEAFTIMRCIRNENGKTIDFVWTYANPTAGKILKVLPEDLIGKRLLETLPGNKETQELFDRYVRIVDTGLGDEVELKYTADGIDGWFRNMTVCLGDGIAISFSDITKRKNAELFLRQNQESLEEKIIQQTAYLTLANGKLKQEIKDREHYELALKQEKIFSETLIASLPGVFYRINSKSQLLGWNKNLETLIGIEGIELAKVDVLNVIHLEDREIITNAIRIAFDEGYVETSGRIYSLTGEYRDFFFVATLWKIDADIFLLGTGIDVTEYKLAAQNVQNLLDEKEIILKEVYHRVKNNMTTVYSLLSIQADTLQDNQHKAILLDAASRVQSMMLLYDKLYRSEKTGFVSVREYFPSLIHEIIQVYPQSEFVRVNTDIDDIVLSSKILSPLGILINELITNAMKYAFIDRKQGVIEIKVFKEDNFVTLIFRDNGVGIPENISLQDSTGFGLNLVGMLTRQIKGTIRIERGNGTTFLLRFEIQ